MWISYSDSEVKRFHPICERALKLALALIGKEKEYAVLHHQSAGSLEMDYAVQNKATGKYLCVVEVKRRPGDVHSARYQFQAMSYVQMNAGQVEQPFYILTNLEYAYAFRYEAGRPRVFQQILEPGLRKIGDFSNDKEEDFVKKLALYFKTNLSDFIDNKYRYLLTLEELSKHMDQIKNNTKKWKTSLAIILYEYIRGAFCFIKRNDLKDIRLFKNDVERICSEAARVNFKEIFDYSDELFDRDSFVDNEMLIDLFDFGKKSVNADAVAELLQSIVSNGREHEGEVPTDPELARAVAELAKHCGGELSNTDAVCDPAAGSGNLLSAAVSVYRLVPSQVIANDINDRLLEILSLKIGLEFAGIISKENTIAISHRNVTDLNKGFFLNAKVVLLNPPFSAGINCISRKQPFYKKIKEITGKDAMTDVGQMPLEPVFLELMTELVRPGSIVSCVFPKTHLMGRGPESRAIRRMLLNKFGLCLIFVYPGEELFGRVTKDTCIVVGKARRSVGSIEVVSSYDKIANLNFHRLTEELGKGISDDFAPLVPGVVARRVPVGDLSAATNDGWRMLNGEMWEAAAFVDDYFRDSNRFCRLSKLKCELKRGRVGNKGGSDILFFDSRVELFRRFRNAAIKFKSGMRNAKLDDFDVGLGDSLFFDVSANKEELVDKIIEAYAVLPKRNGKQRRAIKSTQELKKILIEESGYVSPGNSALVPRAIRKTGKAYLARNPVYVSTNFIVCSLPSIEEAILLSTWMCTIFYQLICEVLSKDQEGMRKMEVRDIADSWIPDLGSVTHGAQVALTHEIGSFSFLNLRHPEIRNIDQIWANELFGEDSEHALYTSKRMLERLVSRRNP